MTQTIAVTIYAPPGRAPVARELTDWQARVLEDQLATTANDWLEEHAPTLAARAEKITTRATSATDALQRDGEAAFETDAWSDEQDRSDWFEARAYELAGKLDTLAPDLETLIAAARDGAGEQLQRSHSDVVIEATDPIFAAARRVESLIGGA